MAKAKQGDTVKIHYTGTLEDGSVFDSSREREPLQFTLGSGQVIPGFDEAVTGMETGDSKTTSIKSDEAYGPYREEMVADVEREKFPPDIDPQVGQELQLMQENDQPMIVKVIEVADSKVTLDGNHPLAGKDLTFELELVEIT